MDIEQTVKDLAIDMWQGKGKNDPSVTTRLAELETDMCTVKEGVSNFRSFQLTAQKRLGFLQGATWFAGIIGIIALAVLGWALTLILPAAKLIIDDYYHNHPAAKISQSEPQNAKTEKDFAY